MECLPLSPSLRIHQQFRDLIATFEHVNRDGHTSWSHTTIVVDRAKARKRAKRDLAAFIRTATKAIERI
jgi:hypothetical protein